MAVGSAGGAEDNNADEHESAFGHHCSVSPLREELGTLTKSQNIPEKMLFKKRQKNPCVCMDKT